MAKNPPKGSGRVGAIKGRDQVHNPQNNTWTKRDTKTGRFIDQKSDGRPFKGVRKNNVGPTTNPPLR